MALAGYGLRTPGASLKKSSRVRIVQQTESGCRADAAWAEWISKLINRKFMPAVCRYIDKTSTTFLSASHVYQNLA